MGMKKTLELAARKGVLTQQNGEKLAPCVPKVKSSKSGHGRKKGLNADCQEHSPCIKDTKKRMEKPIAWGLRTLVGKPLWKSKIPDELMIVL